VRHPGLISAARALSVSPSHLLLVIEGRRRNEALFERWKKMKEAQRRIAEIDQTQTKSQTL
jgi:hypothetical protein